MLSDEISEKLQGKQPPDALIELRKTVESFPAKPGLAIMHITIIKFLEINLDLINKDSELTKDEIKEIEAAAKKRASGKGKTMGKKGRKALRSGKQGKNPDTSKSNTELVDTSLKTAEDLALKVFGPRKAVKKHIEELKSESEPLVKAIQENSKSDQAIDELLELLIKLEAEKQQIISNINTFDPLALYSDIKSKATDDIDKLKLLSSLAGVSDDTIEDLAKQTENLFNTQPKDFRDANEKLKQYQEKYPDVHSQIKEKTDKILNLLLKNSPLLAELLRFVIKENESDKIESDKVFDEIFNVLGSPEDAEISEKLKQERDFLLNDKDHEDVEVSLDNLLRKILPTRVLQSQHQKKVLTEGSNVKKGLENIDKLTENLINFEISELENNISPNDEGLYKLLQELKAEAEKINEIPIEKVPSHIERITKRLGLSKLSDLKNLVKAKLLKEAKEKEELINSLENQINVLNNEKDAMLKDLIKNSYIIAALNKQIEGLEGEKNNLLLDQKKNQELLDSLAKQVKDLEDDKEKLGKDADEKSRLLDSLSAQLKDSQDMISLGLQAKTDVEGSLIKEVQELQKLKYDQDKALKDLQDEKDKALKDLEDEKNKALKDFEDEKNKQDKALKDLQDEKDKQDKALKDLEDEKNKQDKALKDLEDEKDRQDKALKDLLDEKDKQDKALKDLQDEKDKQDKALKDLQDEKDKQEKALKDLEDEKNKQDKALKDLQDEKDKQEKALKDMQDEKDKQDKAFKDLQDEKDGLEKLLKDLEDEKDRLAKLLKDLEDDQAKKHKNLKDPQDKNYGQDKTLKDLDDENNDLKRQIGDFLSQNKSVQQELQKVHLNFLNYLFKNHEGKILKA